MSFRLFATYKVGALLLTCAGLAVMLVFTACEGGGGSSGGATLSGNVESFTASGQVFLPQQRHGRIAHLLSALSDMIASPAVASVSGVKISVSGSDQTAATQPDGSFVIFNVPAGLQTLLFSFNGAQASLEVNVPANGTIELENVEVSNAGVSVRRIAIINDDEDDEDDE